MTTLRTLLVLALGVTLVSSPALAAESDHAPVLLSVLKAYDTVPNAAQLDKITGSRSVVSLDAVARDVDLNRYLRQRGISLLSLYVGDHAARLLADLAETVDAPELRWTAVYTYIRGWAASDVKGALSRAKKAIQDPEPLVREAAVRGLRWVSGPAPVQLVDALAKTEKDTRVLGAIKRFRATRK